MNATLEVPTLSREFVCEYCDQIIKTNDVIHLRESCALPEESTYHVHGSCADPFIEEHPGHWKKIVRDSMDAGWLLY